MKVSLHNPVARRFGTIFRLESSRTAEALGIGKMFSPAQAALASMDGYEEWAAAAFARYASKRDDGTSIYDQAVLASALSRSPLCEVMFAELQLAQGHLPHEGVETYDLLASRYKHVRRWPREMGRSGSLRAMLKKSRSMDAVEALLADSPWIAPADIWEDPVYRAEVPLASFDHHELDLDLDGLMKRLDHEMLVVEAVFDPEARNRLNA